MMKHQFVFLLFVIASFQLHAQLHSLSWDGLSRNGHFGKQHNVHESHIAVGESNFSTANLTRQGRVHVFNRQGNEWLHEAIIEAPVSKPYIQFGFDLELEHDQLIVSAPDLGRGSVFAYHKNNDAWELTQEITIPFILMRNETITRFGEKIELAGNWLAVSAPGYLDDATVSLNRGAVFIFRKDGDVWQFHQLIHPPQQQKSSLYAYDIEMSDSFLIVSSPRGDGGSTESGVVYLFKYNGSTWELDYTFIDPDSRSFEFFGSDVALEDDIVVIGVSMHTEIESEGPHGAAHIFQRFDDTWIRTAFLQPKDGSRNDMFGLSVTVENGNVAISAPRFDHEGIMDVGKVYLFQVENGFWTETKSFIPPPGNIQSHTQFGSALEMHRQQLVISGHLMDNSDDDSGIAYTTDIQTTVSSDDHISNPLSLNIHPNPVNEILHVVLDNYTGKELNITVYDIEGHLLHKNKFQRSSLNAGWKYDVASFHPGTYFLHVSGEENISIYKWIKI